MTEEKPQAAPATDPGLEALLTHLKEERGFDFTGYKRASLTRRINRRLQSLGLRRYEEYQDYLVMHPGEFTTLFNTILINVTKFFRDADAWEYLQREVLPRIVAAKPTGPLRAWCAGCASGEEAYTLAILFAEVLGIEQFRHRVKIYATDVDEEALAAGRQASYSSADVESLPAGLLDRYFERQGQNHVVVKELRRSVIFGRNDLVQDAPISHVDVLTCRNTLMYFNAETQYQILQRLHFALEPDGVLLLGKAEMLLSQSGLFRSLDLRRRMFAKVVSESRDRRPLLSLPGFEPLPAPRLPVEQLSRSAVMFATQAEVLLDTEGRLALANARAANLFGLTTKDIGRPIQDLELSYRPVELRPHLDQAMAQRRQVWLRDASLARAKDKPLAFDVQVLPLTDEAGVVQGCAVVYHDVTHSRQLRQELEFANRQLETAYEELQSTNEELETTNEELQSTVEELETTNEELQSTNEELETMNSWRR